VSGPPGPTPTAAPGPLAILTSSPLPAGTNGIPYDVTLAPSGGTAPYTWSLALGSPALPTGLTLDSLNGKISGTSSTTSTRLTEFKLQDSKGQSVQKVLSITVNAAPTPLTILTPSLPAGTINQPYGHALGGTGGTTPYEWSVTPALPNGLEIDPMSGVISGTPLSGSNGNTNHTFTVTDSTFPTRLTGTRTYSLRINANVTPVTITTSVLPGGTVGQAYSGQLATSGGTPGYTFSNDSPLPAGLSLSGAGAITGTPTATNTNSTTFRVQDSTIPNQQSSTKSLTITINATPPPLLITTTSPLPSGTQNQAYSMTLTATGGTPPLIWSLAVGSPALPDGLILSSSGVLAGTPTTTGTVSLIFKVEDSALSPQSNQKTLSITINVISMPLTITTNSPLPTGKIGNTYGPVTLTATGGMPPYTNWSISPALPAGLALEPLTGEISGTPDVGTDRTTIHTLSVEDSASVSVSKPNISLTVDP
jgi:Putative Ig domain